LWKNHVKDTTHRVIDNGNGVRIADIPVRPRVARRRSAAILWIDLSGLRPLADRMSAIRA